MISNEVTMLVNRMRSHPEEFVNDEMTFSGRHRLREVGRWDSLMQSIVTNNTDLECLFTPEEIKLLRDTATEILRPRALAKIVKEIVGGEQDEQVQRELDFEDPFVYTQGRSRQRDKKLVVTKEMYKAIKAIAEEDGK